MLITPFVEPDHSRISGLFYTNLQAEHPLTIHWIPNNKESDSLSFKSKSIFKRYFELCESYKFGNRDKLPNLYIKLRSETQKQKANIQYLDPCTSTCVDTYCGEWNCPGSPLPPQPPIYPPILPGGGNGDESGDSGGNGGGPDDPCETGNEILDDPKVQEGFDDLWEQSNFGSLSNPNPELNRVEKGGFLTPNGSGGLCKFLIPIGNRSDKIYLLMLPPHPDPQQDDYIYPNDVFLLKSNINYQKETCENLNSKLQETVAKKIDGKPVYKLSYYTAGNYYFAVGSIRQPNDTNKVATGLSFLIIYDSNLNKLSGYSF